MRRAARCPHVWAALGLLVVFVLSAWFIPNRTVLLITNNLVLVGSKAVGITYMPVV